MTNPDMIVEGDQQFTVSLVSTNVQPSNIVLIDDPSLQSATIQNNSSMFSDISVKDFFVKASYSTFCPYAAISVLFEDMSQSVIEGEQFTQICINASHFLERDVIVSVATQSVNATGAATLLLKYYEIIIFFCHK